MADSKQIDELITDTAARMTGWGDSVAPGAFKMSYAQRWVVAQLERCNTICIMDAPAHERGRVERVCVELRMKSDATYLNFECGEGTYDRLIALRRKIFTNRGGA